MVPSSVENRRVAGAVLPLKVMAKPDVVLLTTPLGVEIVFDGLPGGGGMMIAMSRPASAVRQQSRSFVGGISDQV